MTRIDLAAAVAVPLLVLALALPALSRVQDESKLLQCSSNLSTLYKLQHHYMAQFGGTDKSMPAETGDAFWLKLAQVTPPLIDVSSALFLQCPVENCADEGCDYRGPAKNINSSAVADDDVVGADVDGNHGEGAGGTVLQKSGDVALVKPNHILWISAQKTAIGGSKATPTKPTPDGPLQKKACIDIGHLANAVRLYREMNGNFPAALQDLVQKPADANYWPEGGYLLGAKLPKDPWGRAYEYKLVGSGFQLLSFGADGKAGGGGDDGDLRLEDVFKRGAARNAGIGACEHLIDNLTQATKNYELDQNAYPPGTGSGSATLAKALATLGPKRLPYFEFNAKLIDKKGEILDPWGRPLNYKNNAVNWPGNANDASAHNKTSFDIWSAGPDGVFGTADDSNNWD